jgi:hypothetical protein
VGGKQGGIIVERWIAPRGWRCKKRLIPLMLGLIENFNGKLLLLKVLN